MMQWVTCVVTFLASCWVGANEVAGVREIVTILPDNIQLEAKFDTGADHSSLDARDIEFFTKDEKEWVRFNVTRALNLKTYTLEYPIARTSKIVSRVPAETKIGRTHRRPVINLEVCIGDERKVIEVNLVDRSNFKYPFLLGASGLEEFNFLVNVKKGHLLPKECTASSP